jgi:hypothetical protein
MRNGLAACGVTPSRLAEGLLEPLLQQMIAEEMKKAA